MLVYTNLHWNSPCLTLGRSPFFYQLITSFASTRVLKISGFEDRVRALAYVEPRRICKACAGPLTGHTVIEREICRLMRRHACAHLFVVLMADERQCAECQVKQRRPRQKGDAPAGHGNLRAVARIQQQPKDVGRRSQGEIARVQGFQRQAWWLRDGLPLLPWMTVTAAA